MQKSSEIARYSMFLLILAFVGCTESPVNPDDNHEDPEGIVLLINGEELIRLVGDESDTLPDILLGDSSAVFDVQFLADDGSAFLPDEDEGYSLDLTITDSTIVRSAVPEYHDDWRFQLEGLTAGQTSLQVVLIHGGHADFVSGMLTVEVAE